MKLTCCLNDSPKSWSSSLYAAQQLGTSRHCDLIYIYLTRLAFRLLRNTKPLLARQSQYRLLLSACSSKYFVIPFFDIRWGKNSSRYILAVSGVLLFSLSLLHKHISIKMRFFVPFVNVYPSIVWSFYFLSLFTQDYNTPSIISFTSMQTDDNIKIDGIQRHYPFVSQVNCVKFDVLNYAGY